MYHYRMSSVGHGIFILSIGGLFSLIGFGFKYIFFDVLHMDLNMGDIIKMIFTVMFYGFGTLGILGIAQAILIIILRLSYEVHINDKTFKIKSPYFWWERTIEIDLCNVSSFERNIIGSDDNKQIKYNVYLKNGRKIKLPIVLGMPVNEIFEFLNNNNIPAILDSNQSLKGRM